MHVHYPVSRHVLWTPRSRKYCRRSRPTCAEQSLQVVFVGTEAAPWSKVGGLGDVMAALPAALAARGHRVMTVVPRYQPYPEAAFTGVTVPISLPCYGQQCNRDACEAPSTAASQQAGGSGVSLELGTACSCCGQATPPARLYALWQRPGVDRVFVQHSLYDGGPGNDTYSPGAAADDPHQAQRHSVLCQAALAAPALLWYASDQQRREQLQQRLAAVPKTLAGGLVRSAEPPPPPLASHRPSDASAGQQGAQRLVLVANDWQAAPLLLRLRHDLQQHAAPQGDAQQTPSIASSTAQQQDPSNKCPPALLSPECPGHDMFSAVAAQSHSDASPIQPPCTCQSADDPAVMLQQQLAPLLQHARSVYAIHNFEYQGSFAKDTFGDLCLPRPALRSLLQSSSNRPSAAQQEHLNWLQAGILSADLVLTVSASYADDLRQQHGSQQLQQALLSVRGILNGLDADVWDPAADELLVPAVRFDTASVQQGKAAAKALFQQQHGLAPDPTAPLFAFIGRLAEQKGADLLLSALPAVMPLPPGAPPPSALAASERQPGTWPQLAMLGTGDIWLEHSLYGLAYMFPGQAVGLPGFDEAAAHLLLAAADFLVVPSRREPCGLVALAAMRYGAVPLVASTGGLKDIVHPEVGLHLGSMGERRSWQQRAAAVQRIIHGIRHASSLWGTERYRQMQQSCMQVDVSWNRPAADWEAALQSLFDTDRPER